MNNKLAILSFCLISLVNLISPGMLFCEGGIVELGKIIISPALFSEHKREVAGSVTIINREEIELSSAHDVLELIETYAGVFVERTGTYGRQEIKLRGFGDNGTKLLVLINGRPEKMSIFGCTVTQSLTLDDIEKIEIIRGPKSVLYGSDALGGVINIVTRTLDEGTGFEFQGSYGTFDTQTLVLKNGFSNDKVKYFVTAGKKSTDGHRDNSGFYSEDYTGKFAYRFNESVECSLGARYFSGIDEMPGTVNNPTPDDERDYKRGSVDATVDARFNETSFSLITFENFGHHAFFGTNNWHSRDKTVGIKAQMHQEFWSNHLLSLGIDFTRFDGERLKPQKEGKWHAYELSPSIYDDINFLDDHLKFTIGGRYLNYSEAGEEYVYDLGLLLKSDNNESFWLNTSKGLRTPKINELYLFPTSNPDLESENVKNHEIGMSKELISWIFFDFSVYKMYGSNLIRLVQDKSIPSSFILKNSQGFDFRGFETNIVLKPNKIYSQRITYTYQDVGNLTQGRPHHQLNLAPQFSISRLTVNVIGKYFSKLYGEDNHRDRLDDSFTVDSKLVYKAAENTAIFVQGRNIFDKDYQLESGYPLPGAAFECGIQINF
ncbi:MAG: TonB-dependent receptor plug domain-containing protein [bacterium]